MSRPAVVSPLHDYCFTHPESELKARARKYVAWFVEGSVRPTDERPVLDLGCRHGFFLDLLDEAQLPAFGIDVQARAIEECRRRGKTNCQEAEAVEFFESTDRQFAGIYCSHVIEHMTPVHAERLLACACEALAPRGRLVLITPNTVNLHVMSETFHLDPTHVRPYPLPLLEAMCLAAGFATLDKGWDPDTAPRYPLWKWPLHALRAIILGRAYRAGEDTFLVVEKPTA